MWRQAITQKDLFIGLEPIFSSKLSNLKLRHVFRFESQGCRYTQEDTVWRFAVVQSHRHVV